MRIARELHDVLAHNISLINVQAGVALHPDGRAARPVPHRPGGHQAGLQRRPGGAAVGAGRAPPGRRGGAAVAASGLAQLDSLVAGAAATGLEVRTRVEGAPAPARRRLAAFRIVQESLTNVTRHAGPAASAAVRIGYGATSWWWRSRTTAARRPPTAAWAASGRRSTTRPAGSPVGPTRPGPGRHAEQAPSLGGSLEAGPAPKAAFRVWPASPRRRKGAQVDPGAAGRRPGAGPGRVPGAAGRPGGSRWSARPPTARSAAPGQTLRPTWC